MTIYCPPYPVDGIESAKKDVVQRLLRIAERNDPGFCERNGVQLDNGNLPLGKIKHEAIIKRLWPIIPNEAKSEFLAEQYISAVNYVNSCLAAFDAAGIPVPKELVFVKPQPFPGEGSKI